MPARPEVPRAVIGGTGFSEYARDFEIVDTDYGEIRVGHLELGGKEVFFLARHAGLEIPQLVNYRGNIQALKKLDVNVIYAVSACGRLAEHVLPGHLVAVTHVDHGGTSRVASFADTPGLLLHASPEDQCSPGLRNIIVNAWGKVEPKVRQIYAGSSDLEVGFHAHADGVMHAVVKTAQASFALLDEAAAHDALIHALHPAQVDFNILRQQGRTHLAVILEQELASRE